jgi:hypothetical protein
LTPTSAAPGTRSNGSLHVGFLTVVQDGNSYLGGYLVTNVWGRPLEFRLTSAVQPNRVQQVLYAATLQPYLFGELIGKTLVEKSNTPVQLVVTDREAVLELRNRVDVPVVCLASGTEAGESAGRPWLCHLCFPEDAAGAQTLIERFDRSFDLREPFGRIREAIGEARRLGVGNGR